MAAFPTGTDFSALTTILFEQTEGFVGLYDVAAGWFSRVNTAGYQLLGYASAQALYDDPARTLLAHSQPKAEWKVLLARVMRQGTYTLQVEVRRQTGSTFWADLKLSGFRQDGRKFLLVQFADTDLLHATERSWPRACGASRPCLPTPP